MPRVLTRVLTDGKEEPVTHHFPHIIIQDPILLEDEEVLGEGYISARRFRSHLGENTVEFRRF